jgi:hypothetical protein
MRRLEGRKGRVADHFQNALCKLADQHKNPGKNGDAEAIKHGVMQPQ